MKRVSKPPKCAAGRKSIYIAEGGPFDGNDFALTEPSTMVFAVHARGQHWRGRYVASSGKRLAWQDVPIGAEHSALRTLN